MQGLLQGQKLLQVKASTRYWRDTIAAQPGNRAPPTHIHGHRPAPTTSIRTTAVITLRPRAAMVWLEKKRKPETAQNAPVGEAQSLATTARRFEETARLVMATAPVHWNPVRSALIKFGYLTNFCQPCWPQQPRSIYRFALMLSCGVECLHENAFFPCLFFHR